jgi:hypothetical protein
MGQSGRRERASWASSLGVRYPDRPRVRSKSASREAQHSDRHVVPSHGLAGRHPPHGRHNVAPHLQIERQLRNDVRPVTGTAADADRTAYSLDAVGKTDQAGTARGIGPADAVVVNRQQQAAVARGERTSMREACACFVALARASDAT